MEIYFHTTSGGGEGVLEEEERKSGGEDVLVEEERKSGGGENVLEEEKKKGGGEGVLEEEERKSVFVKIPLTGDAGKNFKQVISQT